MQTIGENENFDDLEDFFFFELRRTIFNAIKPIWTERISVYQTNPYVKLT